MTFVKKVLTRVITNMIKLKGSFSYMVTFVLY